MRVLDPQTLLEAYCRGVFPMTDHDGQIRWYTADPRGVIPLDEGFHVPKSLGQFMRSGSFPFEVKVDQDFAGTMRACMETREDGTWISDRLIESYAQLHELGFAHSVEVYNRETGALAGGLYGVSIGGAFFGESMFHNERDASKVALLALVEHLRARKFVLLDTQWLTPHLKKFGAIEISRAQYLHLLNSAVNLPRRFAD